jgi:doubled CXXCH motif protein
MKTMIRIIVLAYCMAIPMPSFGEPAEHHGMTIDVDSPEICANCHDAGEHSSHPIFKSYPPRGKEREYASAAELQAKGIKLVRGQVVCTSCHDLRNPGPHHLVKSSAKSELCLICHIKMGR